MNTNTKSEKNQDTKMTAPNYTQISNEFLSQMSKYKPFVTLVFLAISRKTIGWHKLSDRISQSQLIEMTGLCKNTIKKGIKILTNDKWITQIVTKIGYFYDLNMEEGSRHDPVVSRHDPTKETIFKKIKEEVSISSSAKEELPSFTLSQEKKEEIQKEVNRVYSEDPEVNRFIHSLDPASRINILALEAGSTVTIKELLKYTFDYVRKTGREVKNVPGFVWEGLKNEWQPGDYYTWGLEKLQAGGYE